MKTLFSVHPKFGEVAVDIHKCGLLPFDEEVRPEPPSLGRYDLYPVADYSRVPAWYNEGDFIMPAKPMDDTVPAHLRTGFYFNFRLPSRTALTIAVQRTNPRTGEAIDPRTYQPLLRFADEPKGQNFYTPGSWNNPPWIDGAKISQGIIRQMFITDRSTGLALDEYTLPPELQGSDSIFMQFWHCLIPEPAPRSQPRSMSLESTQVFRGTKGPAVALGGQMAQRVNDVPQRDSGGTYMWIPNIWEMGTSLVIRICSEELFAEIQRYPVQRRPQPQQPTPQNNWPAQSGYPSAADMKGKLPF